MSETAASAAGPPGLLARQPNPILGHSRHILRGLSTHRPNFPELNEWLRLQHGEGMSQKSNEIYVENSSEAGQHPVLLQPAVACYCPPCPTQTETRRFWVCFNRPPPPPPTHRQSTVTLLPTCFSERQETLYTHLPNNCPDVLSLWEKQSQLSASRTWLSVGSINKFEKNAVLSGDKLGFI